MTLKFFQFLTITLYALVTGALWGTWLSLGRTMTQFDAATYVADGHHMIANLGSVMPVLMLSTTAGTILVFLLLPRPWPAGAALLTIVAFALLAAVIVVTLTVEVPIDNQVKSWTAITLPADWQDIRARWATFHTVRTFLSVAGLMCMVASVLVLPGRAAVAPRT
jgi:hypothetical protein